MRVLYMITNLINGKAYIGQTKNFNQRMWKHKYDDSKKSLIHQAIVSYGETNFTFHKIAEVEDNLIDIAERNAISEHNTLRPNGYNIDNGGYGQKNLSEETKEKLRKFATGRKQSPETIEKRASKLRGKHRTEEQKQKIRVYLTGRKRTSETIAKMSKSLKGRSTWNKGKCLTQEHRQKLSATKQRKRLERMALNNETK